MDIKKLIQTFTYIMTGITISAAIFITLFIPYQHFGISLLWEIIIMSLVSTLGNFLYYTKTTLSKRQMKVRIVLHYLYTNMVVFGGALLWSWLSPEFVPEILVMLLLITIVYAIIMLASFRKEEKIAENLNRQLQKCYPTREDEEEE